jgi:hypothetical protein
VEVYRRSVSREFRGWSGVVSFVSGGLGQDKPLPRKLFDDAGSLLVAQGALLNARAGGTRALHALDDGVGRRVECIYRFGRLSDGMPRPEWPKAHSGDAP